MKIFKFILITIRTNTANYLYKNLNYQYFKILRS